MSRKQCKKSLSIYKKFVLRMEEISKMLKVAEVHFECCDYCCLDYIIVVLIVVLCCNYYFRTLF